MENECLLCDDEAEWISLQGSQTAGLGCLVRRQTKGMLIHCSFPVGDVIGLSVRHLQQLNWLKFS